jgi:predicted metal-dependent hydrolase
MALAHQSHTELNPIQISLLKLFNRPMSEQEAYNLKKYLADYYNKQLEEELSRVVNKKGYTQKDFDSMLLDD